MGDPRPRSLALFTIVLMVGVSACSRQMAVTGMKSGNPSPPTASAPPSLMGSTDQHPVPPSQPGAEQAALSSFQDAFFDFDQSFLKEEAKAFLRTDARVLNDHPGMKIEIGGYCDERGTEEYNLALGSRRAEAVKRYLIALGIDPSRLKTISYGEEKPFCTDHTEACYQQNRRGHFIEMTAGG